MELKSRIVFFVEILHRKIFNHEMSDVMRNFLMNLSWSFFGGIVSSAIMSLVIILAGKKLGATGFGEYNSILSLASAFIFFILLGNHVSGVRYISDKQYLERQKSIFSASIVLTLIQTILFIVSIVFLNKALHGQFLNEDGHLLLLVTFSLVLSYKALFDSYFRSFNLIRPQGIIRIIDSLAVLFLFCIAYYIFEKTEYEYYAYSMIFGGLIFVGASMALTMKKLSRFLLKDVFLLLNYNKFLVVGSVAGILIALEKYFIGEFMGTGQLGIYSAYHAVSFLIIANLGSMFTNVFWPTSIQEIHNLRSIIAKLTRLLIRAFPLWLIIGFSLIFVIIRFMGDDYRFSWIYAVLFSVNSYIAFSLSLFMALHRIKKIEETVIISFFCYGLLILSIVLLKDLTAYLLSQLILYPLFIYIYRERILKYTREAIRD